jgi:hypothetical protein
MALAPFQTLLGVWTYPNALSGDGIFQDQVGMIPGDQLFESD